MVWWLSFQSPTPLYQSRLHTAGGMHYQYVYDGKRQSNRGQEANDDNIEDGQAYDEEEADDDDEVNEHIDDMQYSVSRRLQCALAGEGWVQRKYAIYKHVECLHGWSSAGPQVLLFLDDFMENLVTNTCGVHDSQCGGCLIDQQMDP